MPTTDLGRIRNGLIKAFVPTGIADGTELNGLLNWTVYRVSGSADGMFKIQGGEIESADSTHFGLALWGDPGVKWPGGVSRAEAMSHNWASAVPGLAANGVLDHSENTQGLIGNTWEITERTGTGDYGEGFLITNGLTPGQPLTNGQYYDFLIASVQNPGVGNHARGGAAFNNGSALALNDTTAGLSTGVNDGSDTYPGVTFFGAPGLRIRNFRSYKDYRLTVKGLVGSMAFRLYDAGGTPVLDSAPQSGGEAHVNIHLLPWPFTGHIQVFTDNSWDAPYAQGRWPNTSGNDNNLVGGDVFDQVTSGARPGILMNFLNTPSTDFPNEWGLATDVTPDVIRCQITQVAADPRIEVDTCILTLQDPDGKYVPARTESPLYPNVRLEREGRVVLTHNNIHVCRFYGKAKEYQTQFPHKTDTDRIQKAIIRLESPLRELVDSKIQILVPPFGVLVKPDGTGVIADLMGFANDVIPPETLALEPCDVEITQTFLTANMSIQQALEQCCIIGDAVIFIRPHYRVLSSEPNFFFVFRPRTTPRSVVDHTWIDTVGNISYMTPRFTGDDI